MSLWYEIALGFIICNFSRYNICFTSDQYRHSNTRRASSAHRNRIIGSVRMPQSFVLMAQMTTPRIVRICSGVCGSGDGVPAAQYPLLGSLTAVHTTS